MGLSENLNRQKKKKLKGGYSVIDFVPPTRDPQTGVLEKHIIPGNYIGPGTRVKWRFQKGVKPTSNTDAGAKEHDRSYYNIRSKLNRGQINKKQAYNLVKQSDNQLMKTGIVNRMSINPIERMHANAAVAGIGAKKMLQSLNLMDELRFIDGPQTDELEGGRKKKRSKDKLKGLRKRFKKFSL
jgi:hypothetical protein